MRRLRYLFCIIILLLIFHPAFSQKDTSDIRKLFDYLQTEDFRQSLQEFTEGKISDNIKNYKAIRKRASAYRKQERLRSDFWIKNKCLVLDTIYNKPDTSSRLADVYDSLRFRNFTKHSLLNRELISCLKPDTLQIYYLSEGVVEFTCLRCLYGDAKSYNESNYLRLKLEANKVIIISREDMFIR